MINSLFEWPQAHLCLLPSLLLLHLISFSHCSIILFSSFPTSWYFLSTPVPHFTQPHSVISTSLSHFLFLILFHSVLLRFLLLPKWNWSLAASILPRFLCVKWSEGTPNFYWFLLKISPALIIYNQTSVWNLCGLSGGLPPVAWNIVV